MGYEEEREVEATRVMAALIEMTLVLSRLGLRNYVFWMPLMEMTLLLSPLAKKN